jgi:hypothetical protein
MAKEIEWRLVVDDEGAIKKIEEVGKEGEKTDKSLDKTKKSSDGLKGSLQNLGGAFGGLKNMIGLAVGALGTIGVGFGVESLISNTSTLVKETESFRATTGMGAKASLDYVAALKARGVGTEAVVKGYKALGKAVQTAERGEYTFATSQEKARAQGKVYTGLLSVQAEAFDKLGVSLVKLRGESPEKQFQTITEKLEGMKSGLAKTTIAGEIFGRGGTALLPVLEGGALSLNHYRREAEEFFPTLKGGKNVMNEMLAAQGESKLAWEGLEFTIGTAVEPALIKAEHAFAGVIKEIKAGKGAWGGLENDLKGIAVAGKDTVKFLEEMGKAFDIPIGAGGLGAALAAFAGIHTLKHPGKAASTAGKLAKGGFKYVKEHPYAAPAAAVFAAGAALPFATGLGFRKGGEALTGKPLAPSTAELERALTTGVTRAFSSVPLHTFAGGRAAPETKEGELLRELIGIRNAILRLHESGQSGNQIAGEMHLDGAKVGEILALNPKAMRFLTEGVERQGLKRSVGHG